MPQLGQDVVAPGSPQQRQAALLKAFRDVEEFKKVEEFYKGKKLPGTYVSFNLGTVRERAASDRRSLWKCPVSSLETESGELRILLDSFDECLLRLDNVASLLAEQIRRLKTTNGLFFPGSLLELQNGGPDSRRHCVKCGATTRLEFTNLLRKTSSGSTSSVNRKDSAARVHQESSIEVCLRVKTWLSLS